MTAAEFVLQCTDSNRKLYDACCAVAKDGRVRYSDAQERRTYVAETIKDFVTDMVDDVRAEIPSVFKRSEYQGDANNLAKQLVAFALGEIVWMEIADHYLQTVRESAP